MSRQAKGLNALKEIKERYAKIENALNMNAAIYEMLFSAADGDIGAEDLATAIEKAMELNQDAMGFSNNNGDNLSGIKYPHAEIFK